MDMEAFYRLCADCNVVDQQVLARIVDIKREQLKFTVAEEDKIVAILKRCQRSDLAEKFERNLNRHR